MEQDLAWRVPVTLAEPYVAKSFTMLAVCLSCLNLVQTKLPDLRNAIVVGALLRPLGCQVGIEPPAGKVANRACLTYSDLVALPMWVSQEGRLEAK